MNAYGYFVLAAGLIYLRHFGTRVGQVAGIVAACCAIVFWAVGAA